ncbi:MBL fold metallo-hydrolase [Dinoroseobacter sp. S124A]|uniref:MBL fold metallo-hydrolase n=1 Tax=Dinoroseobacter sp. S124A TaxID=3415128 RepID=UPI003C7C1752
MGLEIDLTIRPEVTPFFDPQSNTFSYVVREPHGSACAIIDPVMEFDPAAGRLTYDSADQMIGFIRENGLTLEWIIETHVHADHLSGAPYIQDQLGGQIGIGEHVQEVQDVFGKIFNEGTEFQRDGSQFDRLFSDGDTYTVGEMTGHALHTPGHTPACMVHVIGDACFVGDTLFMPDGGSARADFPGGDAGQLYDSIQRVLSLPDETRLFICHDYGPGGRAISWETTVAEQKANNIHVGGGKTREEFVAFRTARDAELKVPSLILPSLQVNMRAGDVPEDEDGNMVLKMPLNKL